MAKTKYAYPTETEWTLAGVGPAIITNEGPETLLGFGPTLPATYGDQPHHHINNDDAPFYYLGTDNIYVRTMNNNNAGIVITGAKVAISEV